VIHQCKFKFVEIEELLNEKTVDLLFISETKIDSSFTNSIFEVSGYKLERHDRDIHGGGLAVFIRRDIPTRRRHDLECKNLENIIYEVTLNKTKWSILCVYRPPSMSDKKFSEQLTITIDKCITQYDHYLLMGDLNYDLLCKNKGKTLFDLMELFDLCIQIFKASVFNLLFFICWCYIIDDSTDHVVTITYTSCKV
jgi:exonuclease III